MAGLPGTGLGGIFYVCLVVWMIVTELSRGGGRARWSTIARMSGLAAAIVAVLWAEGWLLRAAAEYFGLPAVVFASLTPAVAALPFAILGVLLFGLVVARLLLGPAGPNHLQPLPKVPARGMMAAVSVEAIDERVRERA